MKPFQQVQREADQIREQKLTQCESFEHEAKFKSYYKILTITVLFGTFMAYRVLYSQPIHKNCVVDNAHEWTFRLNRWISENCARAFIGVGQLIMDVGITSMLIYWMLYVKNFRVLLVAAFFQYGRQLILRMVRMPYESYTVWFSPGFPTWTVQYGHTSDYFFSGHTGTIVLLYLQSKRLNLPLVIQYLFMISIGYIIGMLVIGRVHYTVDVFMGVFYGGYCYQMTDRWLQELDMVMNSPYRVFVIVRERVRRKWGGGNENDGTSLYEIEHE